MKLIVFIITIELFTLQIGGKKLKFRDVGTACSKKDPHLTECIKKTAIQEVLPKLVEGIRSLGIPPIDPLLVAKTEVNQSSGPVGLNLKLLNATNSGLKNTKLESFRYLDSGKNKKIEIEGRIPVYSIKGICDTNGRILVLPISGHGECNLSVRDAKISMTLTLTEVVKKDVTYCHLQDVKTKSKFSNGTFELHGLFNGNKQLEDAMNRFLNEHGTDVLNEMAPSIEQTWASIMHDILGRMFSKFPCNELILP